MQDAHPKSREVSLQACIERTRLQADRPCRPCDQSPNVTHIYSMGRLFGRSTPLW